MPEDSSPPPTKPDTALPSLQAARFGKSPPPLFPVNRPPKPLKESLDPIQAPAKPNSRKNPDQLGAPAEAGWLVALKAFGVFIGTFAVVFFLFESPALMKRLTYILTHLTSQDSPGSLAYLPKLQDRPVLLTDIKNRPQDYLEPSAQLAGYSLADLGDDQLLIPKIEVKVPIIWGTAADEPSMLDSLKKGVAHYGFSALPSDGRGKVFLSGHSSAALWDPGQYKTVFANLDRLEIGDQLAVTFRGVVYLYQVTATSIVKPNDVAVLEPTEKPTLSLMTCVPVGTSRDRLVVEATLLSASANRPVSLPPPSLRDDPAAIFHYLTI